MLWHGDRNYRRNSSLSWHGDRNSRRYSLSSRHGDSSYRRESQGSSHGERSYSSSRRDSLPLFWNFLWKTKEGTHHKSATISHENTPATIEADQILLALQQLATNSNSANVNNNSNRFSKLPKSLTTTMLTFDGKSEKNELFEDLFQTSLKIHNQLTEEDKINYFHSLMRGDALQTFKNISSPNREKLGEILTVFRRKYVKPQSMPTAKHKFQQVVFNPANQKFWTNSRNWQTMRSELMPKESLSNSYMPRCLRTRRKQ